jgi:type I restriction-modification system DNA methylase subunit
MSAPKEILDLVERFERQLDAYKSGQYNETQLRREFLDPFFKALGWDIDNEQGHAEPYKDVIHEDAIKVGEATKAPDYCFRIGGARKFFLEAKKPAVDIKHDVSPAFQLRRYAWTTKLPLSILSDFEEFAVYDCRVKPDQKDSAAVARILFIPYGEYAERWGEIASVFSRDAVLKGSFDKYAESNKAKRGTADVDDEFLKTIEGWRADLARNLALRNPKLTQRELNFAVQRIIDRIIFLRICEGRGIEDYGRLQALTNGDRIYPRLAQLFEQADDRYNSGLFHFKSEKDRHEAPDELTLGLDLDDKLLRDILKSLYYPECPYVFSALPADILGQVYEQFLGKVIRLTEGHRAVVEEKPEVKKAGGVYYTPTYIVDYIVRQTVGRLLDECSSRRQEALIEKSEIRNPKSEIEVSLLTSAATAEMNPRSAARILSRVSKLRILDPACGSGSFLLGAYEFLLKWHLDFYAKNDPAKWAKGNRPALVQAPDGSWKLTIAERKRILLDNIYGVDIDAQAVETTKLSLLLKVLEGETQQSLQPVLRMFQERALPDLGDNIKCGNSLIGPDFYQQQQMALLDDEERYRINVFDWHKEFADIFKAGGFDAVIGNPPYVDIKGLPETDVGYIFEKFPTANNRINLFASFLEQSLNLSKQSNFRVSMIVPTALLTQESYRELRKRIIGAYQVASVVRLPNESFGAAAGDVKVDTVIVAFGQKPRTPQLIEITSYAGYDRINKIDPATAHVHTIIPHERWSSSKDFVWSLNTGSAEESILSKCEKQTVPLEDCAELCLGLTPYDKYKGHTESQIKNRAFHADSKKDKTFKRLLAGNDVTRYGVRWNGTEWISYGPWLGAPREQRFFTERRILVKQIIDWTTKRIWSAIADEELYNTQNAFNLLAKPGWQLEYLLGVLNSRLMTFYHQKKFLDEFKMRFQKILIKDCRRFPVRIINFADKSDKAAHDRMVKLVEQMLELHKQLAAARTPQEKTALERQINATDTQIDRFVYDLYGLTEEEIKIVESNP